MPHFPNIFTGIRVVVDYAPHMYFVAWKVSSRIRPCQISLRETPAKLSPASSNYTRVLFLPNYNTHRLITLHCIMASDKRKAPDAFGSTQLVKRTRTPVTEGGSAISIINSSASNGALIQAVCRWGVFPGDVGWLVLMEWWDWV